MRPPRFLVTGSTGQLGWELAHALEGLGEVVRVPRSDVDYADGAAVRAMVLRTAPTVIFNAAAYTAVDRAELEPTQAQLVNADAVAAIGKAARERGAAVVHYSTDYVFDGSQQRPYVETDATNPLNVYGRTKLAGEVALARSGAAHLIIRTSWVFAARGHNFVSTMLRLARERDELHVVNDQFGCPTWARWLAVATAEIARQVLRARGDLANAFAQPALIHLAGGGQTTWHEFAEHILAADPHRNEHRVQRVTPIATNEYNARALRPMHAVLDCSRAARLFGIDLSDWREHLRQMMDDATPIVRSESHA